MSQHSNNRDSFHRMNSASSRGSRGGRRGSYNRIDTSNFPTEQGIICSLKESFGFIHCAQRPDEIFFHYSEVQNEHPDNLDIDVEVEFKVGQSEKNPDKLAAYDVRAVPTGTVIWEIEDEPNKEYYGLVEKVARNYSDSNRGGGGGGGGGGGPIEGIIRVVQLDDNGVVVKTTTDGDPTPQNKDEDQKDDSNNNQRKQQKELIRYRPDEYQPPQQQEQQDEQENRPASSRRSSGANNNRLFRGDLLKFRILIDRRTNRRYARYIALVKTEKERREEQLLANAVEEEGVIIALNKGYGFLKSNKRHEHVYFHFSNFPEAQAQQQQGSNNNAFSDVRKADNNGVLRKGQEVKFLVVTEESTNNNKNSNSETIKKVSARKLQSLPKGSVVFHKVIARGVKGVVTMIPQPPSTSTGDRGYADDKDGNIRLLHPMESIGEEKDSIDDDDYQNVKDVSLQFSDAPGGVYTFQQRGQVVNGLWIQQGDTLLFDVVKELADGSYRAAPTRHTIAVGGEIVPPKDEEQEGGEGGGKENIDEGVIRLVSLSLIGRSEGTVHTIKPQAGYGFIHFAERPIDVHFSTYNVIPEELASDLRKSLGVDTGNRSVPLEMGVSVQFDICAHGTVHASSGGGGGRGGRNYGRGGGGGGHNERENVKGHRILLLPPSTVKMDILIASGVKGVVKSADTKQLYAGFIDLEDDNIQPMSEEDRHPLVTRMVTEFMEETTRPFGRESLVYHDVLSVKEDDVVVNILKSKANGKLSYQHIPVAGFEAHPGRLCIRRADPAPVSDSVPTADDAAAAGGENITVKEKEGGGDGGDEEDKASNDEKIVEGGDADAKPVKKKKDQKKPSKNLRFDKPCLSEECKGDIPPGPGDTIVCDIAQSRRTGKILIHNMKIVERAKPEAGGSGGEESTLSSGIGAVKDVMINRNFGFISVYDENASKRELLFFQLSEVVGGSGGGGSRGFNKKSPVRKNDEVKFDICMDKNGKRVAKKVQIIAKGSIPSKESKNACKGYVLMEPSHSSLKDTPNRKSNRSPLRGRSKSPMRVGGVASRWGSVDKDDSRHSKTQELDIHEEGRILLLEDKIGMFTGKPTRRKRSQSVDDDARSVGSIDSVDSFDDLRSVGSTDGGTTSDEDEKVDILLNSQLPYKNGAIAIQGTGSSSIMDTKAAPRRGDLVSFVKSRKGKSIRDVRIVTRQAATLLRGRLENIERDDTGKGGKAKFIAATDKEELYEVNLVEVVSCAPGILKEKVNVEGILHEGRIYGICRTSDLYLESKLGTTHKQRPKLNLTVKKDRGGTVVAQSMMAKGPDNTIGFAAGWTTRKSQYAASQGE